jgi:hypothetical protein
MKPQIIIDAENNWPEDEAYGLTETLKERLADAQDDTERSYERELFAKDCERMRGILRRESDGEQLVQRFDAWLAANPVL